MGKWEREMSTRKRESSKRERWILILQIPEVGGKGE
jgi:hypothetical protein